MAAVLRRSPLIIMLCGSIILTLAMGARHSAGLFLQPMTAAHGWSRELFSLAIAIQNLLWGMASPFAGALADRWGAARVLVGGAVLYVVGLALMAYAESGAELNLGAGLLVGAGLSGVTFSVVLGVVGRHVPPEKRSMAMGLVSAGGSFGQFAVLPLGQLLIQGLGWQAALLWVAALVALIVPLSWALADGYRPTHASGPGAGAALVEAGRLPAFHFLFWSYFVCGFQTAFMLLHLPSFIVDAGFTPQVGMTAVALIGLFNIGGSFLFGWAGGRYPKKAMLTLIYASRAFIIGILLLLPLSLPSIYLFAALMGLVWLGTVPLTNGLVAHLFGLRNLSMLAGLVFLGHQLGSFLGAWLGGIIYDRSGSYQVAWLVAVALSVLAAALAWAIREPVEARG